MEGLEWSHTQLRHFFRGLRLWTGLACTPLDFHFDSKEMTFSLIPTQSKHKKIVSKAIYGINLAYLVFHTFSFINALNSKLYERNLTQFVLNLSFLILRQFAIFPMGNTSVLEGSGLGLIVSRQSHLSAKLGKQFLGRRWAKPNKLVELFQFVFVFAAVIASGLLGIVFARYPQSDFFLYSIFPTPFKTMTTYFIMIIFEVLLLQHNSIAFVAIIVIQAYFFSTLNFCLKTLNAELEARRLELASGIRAYRLLQLQQILHNSILSKTLNFMHITTLTCFISLTSYATLRLYAKLPFSIYIFFPLCLSNTPAHILFVTSFYVYPNEESLRILSEAMPAILVEVCVADMRKSDSYTKCIKREHRACAPLRCWISGTNFMERSTKLVWLDLCCNLTINFLLTF